MNNMTEEQMATLSALLRTGQKMEAIKQYKEMTGSSLVECKEAIELFAAGDTNAMLTSAALADMSEETGRALTNALFEGRLIEAVKIYKEFSGAGLKDSKEKIETLEAELRKECPEKFSASSKTGCGAIVLVGGMLAALAGWGLA